MVKRKSRVRAAGAAASSNAAAAAHSKAPAAANPTGVNGDGTQETPPATAADVARSVLAACITAPILALVLSGGVPDVWRMLDLGGHLEVFGLGRAALPLSAERQLLIVGTMGSGTTQMSHDLSLLGLEIAHESSDSCETRCRDGTVSWAHGLQYLKLEPTDVRSAAVDRLCSKPRFAVWSSSFYDGSQGFNGGRACLRARGHYWDACWADECKRVASQELGCALNSSKQGCTSPFAHTLLQVRHPLKTIGTLVAAFCNGSDTAKSARESTQLDTIDVLLPPPNASVAPLVKASGGGQCSLRFGWYWVQYIKMMLPHVEHWYRVEDTPPCRVLMLGGVFQDNYWQESTLPSESRVPLPVAMRARSECVSRLATGQDSYDPEKTSSWRSRACITPLHLYHCYCVFTSSFVTYKLSPPVRCVCLFRWQHQSPKCWQEEGDDLTCWPASS
eukprot:COSAG02_NODE_455_length_21984_cov_4.049760_5_plen_447_part_00